MSIPTFFQSAIDAIKQNNGMLLTSEPCPEEHLAHLEKKFDLSLPPSLREILLWSNGVAVKYKESVVPLIFTLEEVEQATTSYRDGADEFADPEVYDEDEIEEAMPVIHFVRRLFCVSRSDEAFADHHALYVPESGELKPFVTSLDHEDWESYVDESNPPKERLSLVEFVVNMVVQTANPLPG